MQWPWAEPKAHITCALLAGATEIANGHTRFSRQTIQVRIDTAFAGTASDQRLSRGLVVPVLVFAFSVGNLPEALSSAAGMRAAGRSYPYILLLWCAIAIGATLALAAGYVGFGSLGQAWLPRLQALARAL